MSLKLVSKWIFTGLVLLALLFIVFPERSSAQTPIDSDQGIDNDCLDLNNPECTKPPTLVLLEFWVIKALYVTWAVGGFVFLFGLVVIGFRWMTSQGDPQKLEELKKQATYWAISIPIFFGGVPAINFVLRVFPVSQENTCTQNLNLPAFQLIFQNSCQPGTTGSDGDGTGGCCDNDSGCFTGETCSVLNGQCNSGSSCLPRNVTSLPTCNSSNRGQTVYLGPSGSCNRCNGSTWGGC